MQIKFKDILKFSEEPWPESDGAQSNIRLVIDNAAKVFFAGYNPESPLYQVHQTNWRVLSGSVFNEPFNNPNVAAQKWYNVRVAMFPFFANDQASENGMDSEKIRLYLSLVHHLQPPAHSHAQKAIERLFASMQIGEVMPMMEIAQSGAQLKELVREANAMIERKQDAPSH